MTAFLLPMYDGSAFCHYCREPVCFTDFLGVQGEKRVEDFLRRKLLEVEPVEVRFVVAIECDDSLKHALNEERVARIRRDQLEYEQYYSAWPRTI